MVAFLVRIFQKLLKESEEMGRQIWGTRNFPQRELRGFSGAQGWCSVIRGHGIISTHFGNVTFEMHYRHPNELFRK